MVQLQVQSGKGITYAIRDGLKNQGVDVSSIDANTWNSIMTEVSSENNTKKSNGKKELYTGGNDLFGSTKNNFVVNEGAINLEETTWNKIVNIVQNKPVEKVEQTASVGEGKQATSIQADTESGKQVSAHTIQSLKNLGATVSDWDGNTCTVSKGGWKAQIIVDDEGQITFSGNDNAMMSLLETDKKEVESVEKQEKFYQKIGVDMTDPEASTQRAVVVQVKGKSVPVIEIATKDGKYYYLDDNGDQVIPD